MFKAIKEFFVGKPKVEEAPAECPYKAEVVTVPVPETVMSPTIDTISVPEVTPVPVIEPAPVVEEIKITTVTLNDQITDAVTVTLKSDTVPSGAWPFPGDKPEEQKKKRTFVKREEPKADKKPTPAIKVNKNKPRKKK